MDTHGRFEFGPFVLDVTERQLLRAGRPIPLTPKSFDTLVALVQHRGRLVTKDELMQLVWPGTFVEENNLTQHVSALRRALGDSLNGARFIETVPRRGYRFVADVTAAPGEPARGTGGGGPHALFASVTAPAQAHDAPIGSGERPATVWWASFNRRTAALAMLVVLVASAVSLLLWMSRRTELRVDRRVSASASEGVTAPRTLAEREYRSGRALWNTRRAADLAQSILHHQRAVLFDPTYPLGYAGLADSYAFDIFKWPEAEELARRASALDPSLAAPHATIGFIRMFWQWKWKEAEQAFQQAIAVDPGYATAHHWYALFFAARRWSREAKAEIQRALEIDPRSPVLHADRAQILYFGGEYDEAIASARRALALEPDFFNAHVYLYQIYTQRGLYSEAVRQYFVLQKLADGSALYPPSIEGTLRSAYAKGGIRAFWRARVRALRSPAYAGHDTYPVAVYHARLGQHDRALEKLAEAVAKHNLDATFLHADPVFTPLWADARFQALVGRIGQRFTGDDLANR